MQQIFVSKWLKPNFDKKKRKIKIKKEEEEKHLQNCASMYDDPIRLS